MDKNFSNETEKDIKVTEDDIYSALRKAGIKDEDTVIVHSSLKSFGRVEGGAETVIAALKRSVARGTLAFPAFRSKNLSRAYREWDVEKTPSDVGLISETFRKSEGVLRSDQETHSVCACGKFAAYITEGHKSGKPRAGVFGDYPFSHSSPWQKIYDLNGKVVLLGVSMVYNTFKHFAEYKMADDILFSIKDRAVREDAESLLSRFSDVEKSAVTGEDPPGGIWFWHDGLKSQALMEKHKLLRKAICGRCTILTFSVRDYVLMQTGEFLSCPQEWFNTGAAEWVKTYSVYLPEKK